LALPIFNTFIMQSLFSFPNGPAASSGFLLLFLAASIHCSAQVITANDSFEGTPIHNYPPPSWTNLNDGLSTVDTQPGVMHNTMPPSEGTSYVSMVTRELNPPGTTETMWANLLTPFQKDKCYALSLDLAVSATDYGTLDWIDYYFNNPSRLAIYGFNGDCLTTADKELLWRSEVISDFSWQTVPILVNPRNNTYHRIEFQTEFASPGNYKNSALLIDHFQLRDTLTSFIHKDGLLELPENSSSIQWYFNNEAVPGASTPIMPELGTGLYRAVFVNKEGCLVDWEENYIFIGNPDWIEYYPNPAVYEVKLKFYSDGQAPCLLYIYNALGKLAMVRELNVRDGNNLIPIDLTRLATGYYHMKLLRPGMKPLLMKLLVMRDKNIE